MEENNTKMEIFFLILQFYLFIGNAIFGLLFALSNNVPNKVQAFIYALLCNYISSWSAFYFFPKFLINNEILGIENVYFMEIACILVFILFGTVCMPVIYKIFNKIILKCDILYKNIVDIKIYVFVSIFCLVGVLCEFYTSLNVVKFDRSIISDQVMIFYIDHELHKVCEIVQGNCYDLKGLDDICLSDFIFVQESKKNNHFDLFISNKCKNKNDFVMVKECLDIISPIKYRTITFNEYKIPVYRGYPIVLNSSRKNRLKIDIGAPPGYEITCLNTETGETFNVCYNSLFFQIPITFVFQLPNDDIVFQLGEKSVLYVNSFKKEISFICKGTSPICLLSKGTCTGSR
jgi:hypothetical protein